MHRKSGRYPNNEYYVEILCLPDDQLFSPSEITKRKYDKYSQRELFQKMFHAIYQFGVRNGITLSPDNSLRRAGGKPFMENGRAKLQSGERSAKWYGKTWKSKLYIEDRIMIKRYVTAKLVRVLAQIQDVKKEDGPMEATTLQVALQNDRPKRKLSFWVAPLIAAIVLTGFSLYNHSFLRQSYDVLRQDGAQAALEFLQHGGESYENLFATAWASYRNGDYEQAEKLSHQILKSRTMKDQARGWYLLGHLNTINGNYDRANDDLLTALVMYETLEKPRSEFRTKMALSKLFLAQKDLENAVYYANLAEVNYPAREDHSFYYLKSQIAFLQDDFESALTYSLEREKKFNGDRSRLAGIYSDIGLYSCLTGDLDQCLSFTVKAQSIAAEIEDNSALMHNNINMCLYLKCSMKDYSSLRESTLAYARSKKDIKLMDQMYFVDKYTCPIIQSDNGHSDPPDKEGDAHRRDHSPSLANRNGNSGDTAPLAEEN